MNKEMCESETEWEREEETGKRKRRQEKEKGVNHNNRLLATLFSWHRQWMVGSLPRFLIYLQINILLLDVLITQPTSLRIYEDQTL